jgi:hypothetical protein
MGGKGAGKGSMSSSSQSNSSNLIEDMNHSNSQNGQQPQPQASGGKGVAGNAPNPNQMTPDGGNMTLSATSGQPQNGQPNPYANTTGSWDNSNSKQIPENHPMAGKSKGA